MIFTTCLLTILCNNIMLTSYYHTIIPTLYAGLLTMPYGNSSFNIIPTLYAGYIVSLRRMVIKNRPVDPGSIQGVTDL